MGILNSFSSRWFRRNQGRPTRIPQPLTKLDLESLEIRVVPTITFTYNSGSNILAMTGDANADQFTLTNPAASYSFSSDSINTFGNDATLNAATVGIPPKQAGGNNQNVTFDNTVLLALSPGTGSDFWLDRSVNAVSLKGGGKFSSYPFGTGDYTITVTGGTGSANYAGKIINGGLGSLALTVNQASFTQILSGANSYSGATKVLNGNLTVNGSLNAASAVSVSGGALQGTGTVGNVTLTGGSLAPGDATGTLNTGNLTFNASSKFAATFKSATLYSAAKVTGTVNLGGSTLDGTFLGFAPAGGDKFTLINNDGADKITGTFAGLPEGSTVTLSGNKFTVSYVGGDGNDVVLTAQASTVGTTTTLDSSANPSVFGQSVTITATVTPASGVIIPTGTVDFFDGATKIGTGNLDAAGKATLTSTTFSVASHSITATYNGSASFDPSTSTALNQVVNQASTTSSFNFSINPIVVGQLTTASVLVSPVSPGAGIPTGTVSFFQPGMPIPVATMPLNGAGVASADFVFTGTAAGGMYGVYNGDSNFVTSTSSTVNYVVNKFDTITTLTSDLNPSVFGQTVTYTSTTSVFGPGGGIRDGTVEFYAGATLLGSSTANNAGVATFTISSLPAGSAQITSKYLGNSTANGSTSNAITQLVNQASTTTVNVSSINPSKVGETFVITATVAPVAPGAGTPGGLVQIFFNGNPGASQTLVGGSASFNISGNQTGSVDIRVDYKGDSNFVPSTGNTISQVFERFDTTTAVAADFNPAVFGQSVTFTATVSVSGPGGGSKAGVVEFYSDAVLLGSSNSDFGGVATFTTSSLPVGSSQITAKFLGNPSFSNGSTSTAITQVVNKADTTATLISDVNPSVFGQLVTFTATVAPVVPGAGVPTGQVSFISGGVPLGIGTLVGGVATLSTSALPVGASSITVEYSGDANFNVSTSSILSQMVNPAFTTTDLSVVPNPSTYGDTVILTAQVNVTAPGAGVPTGLVLFYDNGNLIGSVPVSPSGLASFDTFALTGGSHNLQAVYAGDPNFLGSSSVFVNQQVDQAATTTTLSSDINPSLFGQSVTFTAIVTGVPTGVFPTGIVNFSVNGGVPVPAVLNALGVATFTTSSLSPGISSVVASYTGDGNYLGSGSTPLSQTVNQPPFFTSAATTTFQTDIFGIYNITAGGFPTNITFTTNGTLPAGVTLAADGTIFGTPADGTGGQYDFTVTATNGILPDATQAFSLIVNEPPEFTNPDNVTFKYGVPASFNFTSTGYPATFTYTVDAGVLPSGLTLEPNGLLHGTVTPGVFGDFPIQVRSANGVLPDALQNFTIHVLPTGALYFLDPVTNELTLSLADDVDLGFWEVGGLTNFTITKPGELPFFVAAPGSAILPGDGSGTILATSFVGLTIDNKQTMTDFTDNDIKFTSGRLSLNFTKIDISDHKGRGTTDFLAGTKVELTGNLDVTANNDVTLDGDMLLAAFLSKKGYDYYQAQVTGRAVQMDSIQFDNGGPVTLGNEAADDIYIKFGFETTQKTFMAGSLRTSGNFIKVTTAELLDDTSLDTAVGGPGAPITITDLTQNGKYLILNTGTGNDALLRGHIKLTRDIISTSGNVQLGVLPGDEVTFEDNTRVVVQDGTLTFGGGTVRAGADYLLKIDTIKGEFNANSMKIDPTVQFAGKGAFQFSPLDSSVPVFLGSAANTLLPGLKFNQSVFGQFSTDLNYIQFGQDGYGGAVTMGELVSKNGLHIVNNGGGGKVRVTGTFKGEDCDDANKALYIQGSGATTVLSADIITAGFDVVIDDAVQINAPNIAIDTTNGGAVPAGANVIITGGTAGIFSTKGANNNLSILGGTAGIVDLGEFRSFSAGGTQDLVGDLGISAASIVLNNPSFLAGNIVLTATGTLLEGDLVGKSIAVNGDLYIDNPLTLDSETTIQVNGKVDGGGNNLTLQADAGLNVTGTVSLVNQLSIPLLSGANTFQGAVTANSLAILSAKDGASLTFQDNLTVAGGLTAAKGKYDLSLLGTDNLVGPVSIANAGTLTLGDSDGDETAFTGSAALVGPDLSVKIQGAVISQGDLTVGKWSATNPGGLVNLVGNNVYIFSGSTGGTLDVASIASTFVPGLVNAGKVIVTAGGNLEVKGALSSSGIVDVQTGADLLIPGDITATGDFLFEGRNLTDGGDTSLAVGGTSFFNATGNVSLVNAALTGPITLQVNGDAFLSNLLPVDLQNKFQPNIIGGNLYLASFGTITSTSAALQVNGSAKFSTFGSEDITVTQALLEGPVDLFGKNVSVTLDAGSIAISGADVSGNLFIDSSAGNGDITQTGPILVPNGNADFVAGTGKVVLTNPLNNFGNKGEVSFQASQVDLADTDQVNLGDSAVTGDFHLFTPGNVTQSGVLTVGDWLNFTSYGSITLTNPANSFGTLALQADSADVVVAAGINLGPINIDSGNFNLTTGGLVTQTGPVLVVSPGATTTINAVGFDVILPDLRNDFVFLTVNANDVILGDQNILNIQGSTIGGKLDTISNGSTSIYGTTVAGDTSIVTGEQILGGGNTFTGKGYFSAATFIWLDDSPNTFTGPVFFGGQQITVLGAGDIVLDGGNASISLDIDTTGSISQAVNTFLNVSGNSIFNAGGDILLDSPDNVLVGDIYAQGGNIAISNFVPIVTSGIIANGYLELTGASIGQSGKISVVGTSLLDGGTGDVLLGGLNTLAGAVTLHGNNVTLNNTLATVLDSSKVAGNLVLTSDSSVSQVGGIEVIGTSSFTSTTVADIQLDNAGNLLGGSVSLFGGNATVVNSFDLVLGDTELKGSLSATVKGAIPLDIEQSGVLLIGDDAAFTADGSLFLTNLANEFGTNSPSIGGNVTLNLGDSAYVSTAGPLVLANSKVGDTLGVNSDSLVDVGDLSASRYLLNVTGGASLADVLGGNFGLQFEGGSLTLSGANELQGGVLARGTSLFVDGTVDGTITLVTGTLEVDGVIDGVETQGGVLNVGQLPGPMGVVNLDTTLRAGSTFAATMDGVGPTTGFVTSLSDVVINGAQLQTLAGTKFSANLGTEVVLIDNQSGNAVQGNFNDLPEGSPLVINGQTWVISYKGGVDSQDVVLTRQKFVPPATGPVVAQPFSLGAGSLVASLGNGKVGIWSDNGAYQEITPFPGYTGPLNVSTLTRSGTPKPDSIVVSVAGASSPHVLVVDAATGRVALSFYAFDPAFLGGVNVSGGVTVMGGLETTVILAGAGSGSSPSISVFDAVDGTSKGAFYAFDPAYKGGVRVVLSQPLAGGQSFAVASSNINGHIVAFDLNNYNTPVTSFFSVPANLAVNGLYVASADLDVNGSLEIITGSSQGSGSPRVAVYSFAGTLIKSFNAFDPSFNGGVRVAVNDMNDDGLLDILAASGPGTKGTLNAFNYDNLALIDSMFISDSVNGVAAANNYVL